jgi:hypothetical protein
VPAKPISNLPGAPVMATAEQVRWSCETPPPVAPPFMAWPEKASISVFAGQANVNGVVGDIPSTRTE